MKGWQVVCEDGPYS